ncbi:MAG: NADAR family protein [Selenomonadaceae bacterium]|nr:NADAR family protein [Selenomonadaceae bacterium]
MAICFYKEFGALGYLASYSPHGFYKDGVFWKTVEHYYQAQKFDDAALREKISQAATPKEASEIGRNRAYPLKSGWDDIRAQVMYEAVYLKFKANPDIREKLLSTGDEEIIEETVRENYWGCGPNRDGQNVFGKILCKVRQTLRDEQQEVD